MKFNDGLFNKGTSMMIYSDGIIAVKKNKDNNWLHFTDKKWKRFDKLSKQKLISISMQMDSPAFPESAKEACEKVMKLAGISKIDRLKTVRETRIDYVKEYVSNELELDQTEGNVNAEMKDTIMGYIDSMTLTQISWIWLAAKQNEAVLKRILNVL